MTKFFFRASRLNFFYIDKAKIFFALRANKILAGGNNLNNFGNFGHFGNLGNLNKGAFCLCVKNAFFIKAF